MKISYPTPYTHSLFTRCVLFSILTLSLYTTVSAEEEKEEEQEERIFQIEVIIFERTIKNTSTDTERWPKNLKLSYPEHREKFIDPNSISANTENLPITSSPKFLEFLNESEKSLTEKHKALDRTRGLRTLFHETWLQSLETSENAPALLIKGGNQFGTHFELEGSITLSVTRYLHIKTNLWLTSFVPNYGQETDHWPELPSQEREYFPSDFSAPSPQPEINLNIEPALELSFSRQAENGINTGYSAEDSNTEYTILHESPYVIKDIVTFRQKRKMRSNELHYIDHPRMGLLIKIMPYPTHKTE